MLNSETYLFMFTICNVSKTCIYEIYNVPLDIYFWLDTIDTRLVIKVIFQKEQERLQNLDFMCLLLLYLHGTVDHIILCSGSES